MLALELAGAIGATEAHNATSSARVGVNPFGQVIHIVANDGPAAGRRVVGGNGLEAENIAAITRPGATIWLHRNHLVVCLHLVSISVTVLDALRPGLFRAGVTSENSDDHRDDSHHDDDASDNRGQNFSTRRCHERHDKPDN